VLAAEMRNLVRFENKREKIIPVQHFAWRMLRALAIWLVLSLGGLAIGMAGYALTEGMNLIDAFLNASMILSGMGPVTELKTQGGKLFAGFYALFSGLFIVVATGLALAPLLHRLMHAFHVEQGSDDGD
jgi:cytochrome b561